MASFASMAAAEQRARQKVADGTWINAHAARNGWRLERMHPNGRPIDGPAAD